MVLAGTQSNVSGLSLSPLRTHAVQLSANLDSSDLRYSLTYRDLEEIMAERGLSVDHVTIWRWVQRYAPVLNQRIRRELRRPNRSWRVDETYVKVAGDWAYLYERCSILFHLLVPGG